MVSFVVVFSKNCVETCRATHILTAAKFFPKECSFRQYKVSEDIRGGLLERGRQMRVWPLKMAIFVSVVHCIPIILHIWPHDSFHMMRLSMTVLIFQGH